MRKNPEIVIWFSEIGIFLLEKMAGGGAPCSQAGRVDIAMGIRVFGVRGSKRTSTEQGIFVAKSRNHSPFWRQKSEKTGG